MMTPDRAAAIFRELLMTPPGELVHFSRRHGLMGHPGPHELEHAKDLLVAMMVALDSAPGPNWDRVNDAWASMIARHGKPDLAAMGPAKPEWIRELPAKPSLGDLAPGPAGHPHPGPAGHPHPGSPGYGKQHAERARFVPQGRPAQVVSAPVMPAQAGSYPPPEAHPAPHGPAGPRRGETAARQPPAARSAATAQGESSEASVARYAAFCAACAAFPARVAETQREYGIANDQERAQIDQAWQDRFDDDPALQQRWEHMFHQFRQQLRETQR